MKLIKGGGSNAQEAIEALAPNRYYSEIKQQVSSSVKETEDSKLIELFEECFEE